MHPLGAQSTAIGRDRHVPRWRASPRPAMRAARGLRSAVLVLARVAHRNAHLLGRNGLDDLFLGGFELGEMVAVAEDAEVARHAAVGLDRDPGTTCSPSSKPNLSMSNGLSPMPYAVCVGFSRSWALIAMTKRRRLSAIFGVSTAIGVSGYRDRQGSIKAPGFSSPAGSTAAFAARSAAANGSGRWRSYQARWSRPTAW